MVKKALLIGINYIGTNNQLNGCINDVLDIQSLLITNCGYNTSNICVLTEYAQEKPTYNNFVSKIDWLVSSNVPGDTLVYYYSGHGASINETNYTNGNPHDESDGKDEIIMPVDFNTSGVIIDDWLFTHMVKKVTAGVNLWIFADCCNSGTNSDLYYNCIYDCKSTLNNPICQDTCVSHCQDTYVISHQKNNETIHGNVCMFSGCLDSQLSVDGFINNKYQGVFTACFIAFMKAHCTSDIFQENTLTIFDALKEINMRIRDLHFTQRSMLSFGNINDVKMYLNL